MLENGSFTEGWTDMPPAVGNLINQQPNGWTLRWLAPGESLFGVSDKAHGVPECVHKESLQLPVDEQLGGTHALILEGDATYKIFHATSAFGAELKQPVEGLEPGSSATLIVPIQLHRHGDADPYGAESGVWVNGEGEWVNAGSMGDRNWYNHALTFTVPPDGVAEVVIRVKSKWNLGKDFFIDGITLEAEAAEPTEPTEPVDPDPDIEIKTVVISLPDGVELVTEVGQEPDIIIVTMPENYVLEVE